MFRPPFVARVAAGAAVYAIEETRRLPTVALNFPITAISQVLQTTMHVQQFVTSLALKGDGVFERLGGKPVEQPEWATFDEDLTNGQTSGAAAQVSAFDLFTAEEPVSANGHAAAQAEVTEITPEPVAPEPVEIVVPEIAVRYDYDNMTLAQLRARLRMLTIDDLTALLDYEQQTHARAPFVTMLTNRIATVRAQ
ncbi:lipid droplet-associated protein [Nocardia puris]|uniref:Lipid droplet-associated protein n=1 Tax=Nocardia puris TaxID=208602 RepID=A0A366DTA3_9NOCA|nr:lipid droplet-associated protein [Nocardia puris]MBF6210787.1 lipid droplet-associated protein [Nocardia puris]MBF6364382.1 lipid droplet-associated protein [Nocardia puris]MBF6459311.1 lipid droplet-associated protein [Nocardia puris]RBO92729.1 hypothetical protein DFR74_103373 [Nocardia puris]